MKRPVLIAGLVATALLVVGIFILVTARPAGPLQEGDKAPDFALKGAFGGEGKLSDLRGKVILLNFWATWCSPCIQEMPSLQKLYRAFEGDDFEVVAVSLDAEGESVVKGFAERNRLTFSLVIDPGKTTEEIYHLTGLPETYLIDKEGVIRKKFLGPEDWTTAENVQLVSELLGHGPVPRAQAPATEATAPVTEPAGAPK